MSGAEHSSQADRARAILHEWVESESLRRHCQAVSDSLRHFAPAEGGDPDLWEAVAVKKKMKDKAFARAVNRDDIVRGAAELGRPLEEVIAGVITALQADADRLGLAGTR